MLAGRALAQAGDRRPRRGRASTRRPRLQASAHSATAARRSGSCEARASHPAAHRPGGPAGTGLESLTERELQLARLVVDRKTNPEIADELFLSQKTVETHLRNIFRKVGVSSRVELARAVERAQRISGAPPGS